MSEIIKNENNFVGYEYKDITVKRAKESLYADGYAHFGWMLEGTATPIQSVGAVTMKYKRDRNIRNKAELTRLQRQFEACVKDIERLERSITRAASTTAYVVGVAGTGFMAGSAFAYVAGMLPLTVILALIGITGWIIPYYGYSSIRKKKTDKVAPFIDQKYDEIYEVCQKGNNLLAK
ncbi:hypothetical protein [Paenibacillus sp. Leaf72]|uniref:hypothetical protein n=1 Tax=Paenibacillus sp. Leaf72 TaxID=1736234 RepID=UPI0006FCD049|nr:hypothetical protein [Paenibacillus sp. Leaf72]KQO00742.1 hypothetical protein ASF12_16810 [Paenibacillus sp. Leaf72]